MSMSLPPPSGRSGASLSQDEPLLTKKRKCRSYSDRLLTGTRTADVATSLNKHAPKRPKVQGPIIAGGVQDLSGQMLSPSELTPLVPPLKRLGPTWVVAPPSSPPVAKERQWKSAPQGRLTLPIVPSTESSSSHPSRQAKIKPPRSTNRNAGPKVAKSTDNSPAVKRQRKKQAKPKVPSKPYLEEPEEGEWDEGGVSFVPSQTREDLATSPMLLQAGESDETGQLPLGNEVQPCKAPRSPRSDTTLAEFPLPIDKEKANPTGIIASSALILSPVQMGEGNSPLVGNQTGHQMESPPPPYRPKRIESPLFLPDGCGTSDEESTATESSDEDGNRLSRLGLEIGRSITRRDLLQPRSSDRNSPIGGMIPEKVNLPARSDILSQAEELQQDTLDGFRNGGHVSKRDTSTLTPIGPILLSPDTQVGSSPIQTKSKNLRSKRHKVKTYSKRRRHSYQHGVYDTRDPAQRLGFLSNSPTPYRGLKRKGSTSAWPEEETQVNLQDSQDQQEKPLVKRARGRRNGEWPENRAKGLFTNTPPDPNRQRQAEVMRPFTTVFDVGQIPRRVRSPLYDPDFDPLERQSRASRRSHKSRGRFHERRFDVLSTQEDLIRTPHQPQLHMRSNIDDEDDEIIDHEDVYMSKLGRRFRPDQLVPRPKQPRRDRGTKTVPTLACRPLRTIKFADYKQQLMTKTPEERHADFLVNPRLIRVAKRSIADAAFQPVVRRKANKRVPRTRPARRLSPVSEEFRDSIDDLTPSQGERPQRRLRCLPPSHIGQLAFSSRSPAPSQTPQGTSDRTLRFSRTGTHTSAASTMVGPVSQNRLVEQSKTLSPFPGHRPADCTRDGEKKVGLHLNSPGWTAEVQELERLGQGISQEELERLADELSGIPLDENGSSAIVAGLDNRRATLTDTVTGATHLDGDAAVMVDIQDPEGDFLDVVHVPPNDPVTGAKELSGVEMTAYLQNFLKSLQASGESESTRTLFHARLEERRLRLQARRGSERTPARAAAGRGKTGKQLTLDEIQERNAAKSLAVLTQPFKAPSQTQLTPMRIHAVVDAIFRPLEGRFATQPSAGMSSLKPPSTVIQTPHPLLSSQHEVQEKLASRRSVMMKDRATWGSSRVYEQFKTPLTQAVPNRPSRKGKERAVNSPESRAHRTGRSSRQIAEAMMEEADREADEQFRPFGLE
ncbi:hypothetical protein BCR39DRAFT_505711 [Naematelia encephala]|uniref:Uncharacterized protein n=1 Tax=Naematelia encephala TaxID=71784 RepID=A0A1Y2B2H1_9TREE|nr:hypothetical protein BCR39DRAFT_505711 [Naematelia encephala]